MNKMTINRYNYQEYFLLYTDNELEPAERAAIESFVQQNPDLEGELRMLQESVLRPDDKVVFENKELLFHFGTGENVITSENFIEFAISYSDKELNKTEKVELENFILDNPQHQQEFDLIQSIKLSADESISFPDKQTLHRYEKNTRPLILSWWRIAAAAVILCFAGLLWFYEKSADKHLPLIARETKPAFSKHPGNSLAQEKKTNLHTDNKKQPEDITSSSNPQPGSDIVMGEKKQKEKTRVVSGISSRKTITRAEDRLTQHKQDEYQNNLAADLRDNELPKPIHIDNNKLGRTNTDADNMAFIEASIEKNNRRIKEQTAVNINGLKNDNYLVAKTVSNTEEEDDGSLLTDKKSPLRGILRKASRFIDKNTSSRTSKKSGLLIGNVEIAFQ